MDQFGVLDQLIFNQVSTRSAEPIARTLGMVHLYRASGVHLLAFFTFLEFFVEWTCKCLEVDPKRSRFFGLAITGITIFWIWKLQDYRVTLVRPVFTFLIRLYFQNRGAKAKVILPLVLTFIFEYLLSPATSFSSGAFHYYLSVAGGLIASELMKDGNLWRKHLSMAVGSWLPIAIVSLVEDHLVSYLTPLYSLITLPIISLVLYPLTLIDILIHGQISNFDISIWDHFLKILFWVPDLGPTYATVSKLSVWIAFPLAVGIAYFLPKMRYQAWVFCFLSLGLSTLGRAEVVQLSPEREVIQLDVHQGDAAVMEQKNGPIEMVDVGSARTYAPDIWLGKLSKYQMTSIDGIMLTHLDDDHVGALKELLLLTPVTCVETSSVHWQSERGIRLATWIHENAPKVKLMNYGCIRLSRVSWFQSKRGGGNELMGGVVFPITDHEAYFALGDGDEEQERSYEHYFATEIATYPQRIWKVGHHGSRFSSNLSFLERMDPEFFWISVGKHNPYHHPNPLTLWKLSTLKGRVRRTDESGDLSL